MTEETRVHQGSTIRARALIVVSLTMAEVLKAQRVPDEEEAPVRQPAKAWGLEQPVVRLDWVSTVPMRVVPDATPRSQGAEVVVVVSRRLRRLQLRLCPSASLRVPGV